MIERYSKPFLIHDLLQEPYLSYLTQLENTGFDEIALQFKPIDESQFNGFIPTNQTGATIDSLINTNNMPKDENLRKLAFHKRLLDKLGACNFDIDINENTRFEGSQIEKVLIKVKSSIEGKPHAGEFEVQAVSEDIDAMLKDIEDFYAENENLDIQKFIGEFKQKASANADNDITFGSTQLNQKASKELESFKEIRSKIDFEGIQRSLEEVETQLDSLDKDLESQVRLYECIVQATEKGLTDSVGETNNQTNAPLVIGGSN